MFDKKRHNPALRSVGQTVQELSGTSGQSRDGATTLPKEHRFDAAMRTRAEEKKKRLPKDFGTLTPRRLDAFLDGFHKKLDESCGKKCCGGESKKATENPTR